MRYQVFQSPKDKKYYFHLKSNNGWVLMTSKPHKSNRGVADTIAVFRKLSGDDDEFERKITKNGRYYYEVSEGKNKPIATSRSYKRRSSMERTIKKVAKYAPKAHAVEKQPIIKVSKAVPKKRDEV